MVGETTQELERLCARLRALPPERWARQEGMTRFYVARENGLDFLLYQGVDRNGERVYEDVSLTITDHAQPATSIVRVYESCSHQPTLKEFFAAVDGAVTRYEIDKVTADIRLCQVPADTKLAAFLAEYNAS